MKNQTFRFNALGHRLALGFFLVLLTGLAIHTQAQTVRTGPEGFFDLTREALTQGRAELLLDALPASYTRDLETLARGFGQKMDPTLYKSLMGLLRQTTQVMQTKKPMLLASPTVKKLPLIGSREEIYDQTTSLLSLLTRSALADTTTMQRFQLRPFMQREGTALLKIMSDLKSDTKDAVRIRKGIAMLKETKATVKSIQGDKAMVSVNASGKIATIPFVRVDGRWLPEDLADNIERLLDEGRRNLRGLNFEEGRGMQAKAMGLMAANMGRRILDDVQNAQTQAELEKSFDGIRLLIDSIK